MAETQGQSGAHATRRTTLVPTLIALALFFCALGASLVAQSRAVALRDDWPPEVDELYLPPAKAIRWASVGHTELMADLIAARTNVYFGEQLSSKSAQKWLSFYLNTVVDLDPNFEPIYMRGAAMIFYNGQQPTLERIEAANRLLERGIQHFPDKWDLWFQLGFNKAFEMPGIAPKDPRIEQWKREGTEALRRSTYFDGIPAYLPNLVAKMLTEQGERELAIQHLERTYAVASDPRTRQSIRNKILQLMGENYAASFENAARNLGIMVAERYPYAPEAFSLIAGERQTVGVDLKTLGRPALQDGDTQ